jgi:hypothetical protein
LSENTLSKLHRRGFLWLALCFLLLPLARHFFSGGGRQSRQKIELPPLAAAKEGAKIAALPRKNHFFSRFLFLFCGCAVHFLPVFLLITRFFYPKTRSFLSFLKKVINNRPFCSYFFDFQPFLLSFPPPFPLFFYPLQNSVLAGWEGRQKAPKKPPKKSPKQKEKNKATIE